MPETGKINPGMAEIDLIDKLFDSKKTENYHISIQLDLGGVSFCILDTLIDKYVAFKRYLLNKVTDPENLVEHIEKIISTDNFLHQEFKSSSLIFFSQKSTLVPSSFFDKEKVKDLFEFNHYLEEFHELHFNYISCIDAYNVFAIPTVVANAFYNKFRNIKFFHQATPFIKSVINGFSQNSGVHICLNHDFFDIIVKEDSKLKLYNTFRFINETDLLYFVFYVMNQLKVDKQTLMTLSGELSDNSVFFKSLNKYFSDLSYLEPAYPKFAESFDKFDKYKYFNQFYLYNCES